MKKINILLIVAIPTVSLAQSSSSKKEYNPRAGISIIGGMQYNKYSKATPGVFGIELSMECPLDQGQKSPIRQKISVIRQEGGDLKSLHVEINPQCKLVGTPSFELGIGPVAGMIFTKMRDKNKPVFTYGAGAGAVYYFKKFFIGIESRYGFTKKIAFEKTNNESEIPETANLNNIRTFVKLGYQFGN